MRIPGAEIARIPLNKLEGYLLSEVHPVGRSKALFLKNLGYDITDVDVLARDLLTIILDHDISNIQASEYGTKYIVDGRILTPNGLTVAMRTVWIVETNDPAPRFVTAYPA